MEGDNFVLGFLCNSWISKIVAAFDPGLDEAIIVFKFCFNCGSQTICRICLSYFNQFLGFVALSIFKKYVVNYTLEVQLKKFCRKKVEKTSNC